MSFHLFQPVQKTDLLARGRILKSGKRQDIADMRCWDQDNNLVAHATGTFLYLDKLSIQEPPKP
jgi:acyl-coenzyme A thioesterase PaaI-like protein